MSVDIVNSQAILIPFLDIVRMVVAQSSDQIGWTASEIFKENVRADAHICQRIEQIFRTLDTVFVPSPVDLHQSDIYARSVLQNLK